jgi:hypothetical protein
VRERVAAILQAVGIAAGVAAGFTVSVTAGLGVACLGCLALGIALERG